MADLGNIANNISYTFPNESSRVPVAWYVLSADTPKPHILSNWGRVSGAAVYSTTPVQYATVWLMYNPTGAFITRTKTDGSGLFVFKGLYIGGSTKTYTAVAFKEGQNARVFTDLQAYDPYI